MQMSKPIFNIVVTFYVKCRKRHDECIYKDFLIKPL